MSGVFSSCSIVIQTKIGRFQILDISSLAEEDHSGCSSRGGARDGGGEEPRYAQELFFGYVRRKAHEMEGSKQPRCPG